MSVPDSGQCAIPTPVPTVALRQVSLRFGTDPGALKRASIALGLSRATPVVKAVDGVDFEIVKGEVVGLVGESGCGKSTLGRIVAGILPASSGDVLWRGRDIRTLTRSERRQGKLRNQMIFQNPYASINPRLPIAEVVGEAPRVHGLIEGGAKAYGDYVDQQLARAGLDPSMKNRYAHEFSGGQRQRVGIARALAVNPEMLVCDEAVAALDVSIQAQIINLFMDLRETLSLTYLFISHDLGVVEHLSDRVVIMYLGRIVEEGPTDEIFSRPNHPYTQALLSEVPRISTSKQVFTSIKGELPSALNPPPGCHFHPRCPHAFDRCKVERPIHKAVAPLHKSACHLNELA